MVELAQVRMLRQVEASFRNRSLSAGDPNGKDRAWELALQHCAGRAKAIESKEIRSLRRYELESSRAIPAMRA